MIASVYIKEGCIHFYNENKTFSDLGGLAYDIGRPLLDFVCYEPERFGEALSVIASAFDDDFAYLGARSAEFVTGVKEEMTKAQEKEIYVYFYAQMFWEFIFTFLESPYRAVSQLEQTLPGAAEKLSWAEGFEWPEPSAATMYRDEERRLHRAAFDVIGLMSEHLKTYQEAMINEITLLMNFRAIMGAPEKSPMEYLYMLEQYRHEKTSRYYYLERPFCSFYGALPSEEIVELYEIDTVEDLFSFEFIKMIERDIFIKKCRNCERFFIPRRRADAEYCDRLFADTDRKCSEIGAMLRYEKKVAGNPILEAHKKAYRRFHSRVRAKKMTQNEFRLWSDEAESKRDACLAGTLPFDEFVAWLEQGRLRRARGGGR